MVRAWTRWICGSSLRCTKPLLRVAWRYALCCSHTARTPRLLTVIQRVLWTYHPTETLMIKYNVRFAVLLIHYLLIIIDCAVNIHKIQHNRLCFYLFIILVYSLYNVHIILKIQSTSGYYLFINYSLYSKINRIQCKFLGFLFIHYLIVTHSLLINLLLFISSCFSWKNPNVKYLRYFLRQAGVVVLVAFLFDNSVNYSIRVYAERFLLTANSCTLSGLCTFR